MATPIVELELVELEEGEVGEPVVIETPTATFTATWLGVVGNGPGAMSLAEAMRLMADLERERMGAQVSS
jgi:hypothetical protein